MEASDDANLHQVLGSNDLSFRFDCGVSKPFSSYHISDKPTILKLLCLNFVIL